VSNKLYTHYPEGMKYYLIFIGAGYLPDHLWKVPLCYIPSYDPIDAVCQYFRLLAQKNTTHYRKPHWHRVREEIRKVEEFEMSGNRGITQVKFKRLRIYKDYEILNLYNGETK